MKKYKIYLKPNQEYEAVKIGWSWPAFLFAGCWALTKGLWLIAIFLTMTLILLLVATLAVLTEMDSTADNHGLVINTVALIWIAIKVGLGMKANVIRESKLLYHDSILQGTILAKTDEFALFSYYQILAKESDDAPFMVSGIPHELVSTIPPNDTFKPA